VGKGEQRRACPEGIAQRACSAPTAQWSAPVRPAAGRAPGPMSHQAGRAPDAPARAAAPHSPPGYGGRGVSRPRVGVGKLSQAPPLRRGLVLRSPRSVFYPCRCAISAISAIWHEGPIRWVQAGSGDPAGAGPQQVAASRGFDGERPFGLRKTQRVIGHGGEGCDVLAKP
jgi:hypothetical protein